MGQVVVIWIIMRNFQRKRAVKGPPGENGKSALGGSELHITRVKWSEVKWKSLSLCVLMDYIVHAVLQARILEWVAFPFSRGSSQPRDRTQVSYTESSFFTNWATRAGNSLDGRQHSLYSLSFLVLGPSWLSAESMCPISETYFQSIKLYNITKETSI